MFQGSVNNALPVGLAGDWASENPAIQLIPPFGFAGGIDTGNAAATNAFVAAAAGVVIGAFAWIQTNANQLANVPQSGSTVAPDGFVYVPVVVNSWKLVVSPDAVTQDGAAAEPPDCKTCPLVP
jgi:hypothetical protein